MATQTALIIDDEPDIRELVSITISRLGLECHTAENLGDAKNLLAHYNFDLCFTDMRLPDGNGVDFVEYMQDKYPDIPIAVITAHGNMEAAVKAMKLGAFDFVSKPVDIRVLRKLIESAAKTSKINKSPLLQVVDKNTNKPISVKKDTKRPDKSPMSKLLGQSATMIQLKKMISKLAKSQAPVLISGESGTGKELVARLIHDNGPRTDKPFIPVNCGAIPAELMESEFFGHKKGSFTGATQDKNGLFQAAEDGTLFLDEVAELPLYMQVKLLRAIQEKAVKPVGSTQEVSVNIRILSASYKNLEKEVEAKRFRHDLYYRLNVINIEVPPLRDRPEDIPELTESLLNKLSLQLGIKHCPCLSSSAQEKLQKHPFSGNVRELENILERAVTLAESNVLQPEDLFIPGTHATDITSESTGLLNNNPVNNSPTTLQELENVSIIDALEKTHWNRKAAAKILGISYRQLRYRIEKLGLDK